MFERYRVIHFVGIGGIGMSGIAEVLYNLGYEVTGSDLKIGESAERLIGLGVKVYEGHRAENVNGAHVVVISSAVKQDNPEVVEATRQQIPVIPRAEMLAELGRLKYAVLVAGAHGKTTTTSIVATILAKAGFDPTVVIGGRLKAFGTNARLGRGEFMVAEADESDGSFLKLSPTIGVVTNIDREHMEHFKTMEALKAAFLEFMNKVPFYGVSVLCIDDPNVRELLPMVHRKVLTYGLSADADLRASSLKKGFMCVDFDVEFKGVKLGMFRIPASGEHNVRNALAGIAVALELQIPAERIKEALAGFEGIQRRFEFKGEAKGIMVYDDYGHHPTEIRATLGAAKDALGHRRLVVIFQPHRYTRTRDLMDEFASAFEGAADVLICTDIYPAGERPIEGVTAEALIRKIKSGAGTYHAKDPHEAARIALGIVKSGDVVLTLGAGNIYTAGEELLRELGDG